MPSMISVALILYMISCVLNFSVVTHMHRSLMESTCIIELTRPESWFGAFIIVVSKQANVANSRVRTKNESILGRQRSNTQNIK